MPVPIINEGAFDATIRNQVNLNFQQAMGLTTGNIYYLDVVHGSNNNSGLYPSQAFATIAAGYAALRSGYNDVLAIIGNGATTSTARLGANFAWAKSAAHLVGVCTPTYFSQRGRIAPTSGATAFANFFTISGTDCLFQNIEWFDGFSTGTTSQINVTLSSSSRCVFQSCHIAGMGDNESAQSAGSRSLKISAGGEHVFRNCVIGLDTITRTAANASLEFSGGTARNVFEDCLFPFMTSAATPLGIIVSAAAGADRFQMFKNCSFINAVQSTSTTISGLSTLAASMGGMLFMKDCSLVGITEYGTDATSRGQIYIDGGTVTAATSGIAVNPT